MERGLTCGPKIWGNEKSTKRMSGPETAGTFFFPLAIPIPNSQSGFITPLDYSYLQFFLEKQHEFEFVASVGCGSDLIRPRATALLFSSEPVRCAILAYASFVKTEMEGERLRWCLRDSTFFPPKKLNVNTLRYIGQCYKSLRDAIANRVTIDLAYACGTLFLVAAATNDSMETIFL